MANRFEESNSILIESLKENAKKLNKAQTHWLRVWRSWTAQKGYDQNIKKNEPEALNKILEDFHGTVRKKRRERLYKHDSLLTAIERYLRRQGYEYSIIRVQE